MGVSGAADLEFFAQQMLVDQQMLLISSPTGNAQEMRADLGRRVRLPASGIVTDRTNRIVYMEEVVGCLSLVVDSYCSTGDEAEEKSYDINKNLIFLNWSPVPSCGEDCLHYCPLFLYYSCPIIS